ncbi:formate dehydrogenase accessory sulfurtransferase FdhD [Chloroflexus sp.]|uniref:formate dehydrogenase accessory sulfurtransferase FdhD n=1 Tax=Chloroflexus sp. TaxID=1904827 RepID=UPI0026380159|nr:formate dehydrogenase accessory sulfurtransferase FdhD [uncultured Chloroflexus sp.]
MITRATVRRRTVVKVRDGRWRQEKDVVVVEEPLEIRLLLPDSALAVPLATVMRTPGADVELAAGFLFGESIIRERYDISTIRYCVDADLDDDARFNTLIVALRPGLNVDLDTARRLFFVSSSCGVCGKASLESLRLRGCAPLNDDPPVQVSCAALGSIDGALRQAQDLFARTGGLHAAALFTPDGRLLSIHEDIGRHNAVDKLIGAHLLSGQLEVLRRSLLLVSGRASFEIMQKALMARIPIVVAVGAPSALAVAVAQHFNMTLIGFLRGASCNIYAGAGRIIDVAMGNEHA